jgi:hypothetical protein
VDVGAQVRLNAKNTDAAADAAAVIKKNMANMADTMMNVLYTSPNDTTVVAFGILTRRAKQIYHAFSTPIEISRQKKSTSTFTISIKTVTAARITSKQITRKLFFRMILITDNVL